MCFVLFTSLLCSKSGLLYCLRHFYIAIKVFLIVYVTFLKRARFPELFTSLLQRDVGVLNCLCYFYIAREFFAFFTSCLYSKRVVLYSLRHFYIARGVLYCLRHFCIAREVYCIVYGPFI